jgi:hypothetical protein
MPLERGFCQILAVFKKQQKKNRPAQNRAVFLSAKSGKIRLLQPVFLFGP